MSPSSRQSTTFLPPGWTGEPDSDPFWTDGVACSAFYEESLRLFEGVTTSLEGSVPMYTDYPLPSLVDGNLTPPPASFGGADGIDGMFYTFAPSGISFSFQPDELYATFSSSRRYRSHLLTALHPII